MDSALRRACSPSHYLTLSATAVEDDPSKCVVDDVHGDSVSCPIVQANSTERRPTSREGGASRKAKLHASEQNNSTTRSTSKPESGAAAHRISRPLTPGGSSSASLSTPTGNTAHNRHSENVAQGSSLHTSPSLPERVAAAATTEVHGAAYSARLISDSPTLQKRTKSRSVPLRLGLASRGAFSSLTSVGVLERLQPLDSHARQVEPVGWYPLLASPIRSAMVCGEDFHDAGEERKALPVAVPPPSHEQQSLGQTRKSAVASASVGAGGLAAHGGDRDRQQNSGRGHSLSDIRGISEGSHTRDAERRVDQGLEKLLKHAETSQQRKPARTPTSERREGTARGVPKATTLTPTLARAQSLPPSALRHHSDRNHGGPDARPPYSESPPSAGNAALICVGGKEKELPHRLLKASAPQPFTCPPLSSSCAPHEMPSLASFPRHFCESPQTPSAASRTPRSARVLTSLASHTPRGFEKYVERGQLRRAEAERAHSARVAAASGESSPTLDGQAASSTEEEAGGKRPRKMAVLPPPRGYEAYAERGVSRRAEADRDEMERLHEDDVNCTYHPLINRRSLVSATSLSAGAVASRDSHRATPVTPREVEVSSDHLTGAADALSLTRPLQQHSTLSPTVFDRLNEEAMRRKETLRKLEEQHTPLFVPELLTGAAMSAEAHGNRENSKGAPHPSTPRKRRDVFEEPYNLSKVERPKVSAAASAATPRTPRSTAPSGGAPRCGPDNAAGSTDDAAPPVPRRESGDTVAKKSQEAISRHVALMASREERRQAKLAQIIAAKEEQEKEACRVQLALDPITNELAARARARWQAKEEKRQRQQRTVPVKGQAREKTTNAEKSRSVESRSQCFYATRAAVAKVAADGTGVAALPSSAQTASAPTGRHTSSSTPSAAPGRTAEAAARTPRVGGDGAFYEQQMLAEKRRQQHLRQVRLQRAEEELSDCVFRPRLNGTSVKLAQHQVVTSYRERATTQGYHDLSLAAAARQKARGEGQKENSLHRWQSPFVSSRSHSLLQELRRPSPLVSHLSHSPSSASPMRQPSHSATGSVEAATNMDYNDSKNRSRSEDFVYDVHRSTAVGEVATALPPHHQGSLTDELQNVEEMVREWRELERECDPILL